MLSIDIALQIVYDYFFSLWFCVCVDVYYVCWYINTQWGMDAKNNAALPSIERIMKLAYFDGINQTMEEEEEDDEPSDMVTYLMHKDYYDYLLLITKYFGKNNMIFNEGINTAKDQFEDHPLVELFEIGYGNEKWLMLYFDMLKKCKMIVPQDVLKKVFDSMDTATLEEEEEREKCKSFLKRHLSKNVN